MPAPSMSLYLLCGTMVAAVSTGPTWMWSGWMTAFNRRKPAADLPMSLWYALFGGAVGGFLGGTLTAALLGLWQLQYQDGVTYLLLASVFLGILGCTGLWCMVEVYGEGTRPLEAILLSVVSYLMISGPAASPVIVLLSLTAILIRKQVVAHGPFQIPKRDDNSPGSRVAYLGSLAESRPPRSLLGGRRASGDLVALAKGEVLYCDGL